MTKAQVPLQLATQHLLQIFFDENHFYCKEQKYRKWKK